MSNKKDDDRSLPEIIDITPQSLEVQRSGSVLGHFRTRVHASSAKFLVSLAESRQRIAEADAGTMKARNAFYFEQGMSEHIPLRVEEASQLQAAAVEAAVKTHNATVARANADIAAARADEEEANRRARGAAEGAEHHAGELSARAKFRKLRADTLVKRAEMALAALEKAEVDVMNAKTKEEIALAHEKARAAQFVLENVLKDIRDLETPEGSLPQALSGPIDWVKYLASMYGADDAKWTEDQRVFRDTHNWLLAEYVDHLPSPPKSAEAWKELARSLTIENGGSITEEAYKSYRRVIDTLELSRG